MKSGILPRILRDYPDRYGTCLAWSGSPIDGGYWPTLATGGSIRLDAGARLPVQSRGAPTTVLFK